MDTEDLVRSHYRRDDLEERVLEAMRRSGADPDALTVADLAGLDNLHAGSLAAAEHVLDVLGVTSADTLLDVGSGIGGPARLAASRHGCRVTGIDLSPDFVALARSLTDRVGLTEQVSFDVGSATSLPYPDGTFSAAMQNHVGMNIADKAAVFAEVRRVLGPGGRFSVYDQMRVGDGDLTFPVPWAEDPAASFVETRQRYAELLDAAGFRVEHDEDRTAANAAGGPPQAGALSLGDLFGPGFDERMRNVIVAAMSGTIGGILMIARAI